MKNLFSKNSIVVIVITFCISSILLFGILVLTIRSQSQSISPTITQLPTPTTTPEIIDHAELLEKAQKMLETSPEEVFDILLPKLDKITDKLALGEAYVILGLAFHYSEYEAGYYEENEYFIEAETVLNSVITSPTSDEEAVIAKSYLIIVKYFMEDGETALNLIDEIINVQLPKIEETVGRDELFIILKNIDFFIQEIGAYDLYDLFSGHSIKILSSLLDEELSKNELIFGCNLMGNIYSSLNEFYLAAHYFLRAYKVDNNSESLANAAYTFYLAGDSPCAYHYFNILSFTSDYEEYIPRRTVEEILDHIIELYDGDVPACKK